MHHFFLRNGNFNKNCFISNFPCINTVISPFCNESFSNLYITLPQLCLFDLCEKKGIENHLYETENLDIKSQVLLNTYHFSFKIIYI